MISPSTHYCFPYCIPTGRLGTTDTADLQALPPSPDMEKTSGNAVSACRKEQPLKTPTLKDRAYEYIRHKLKMCEYMPGESINEVKIMEETGIGRTPVREAVLSLKEEGLIEIRPRKGTFASPITEFQINESYQIRRLLEPAAAVKYKQRFDKGILLDYDALFEHLDTSDDEKYYDLDIRFHQSIINATGNPMLMDFYEKVMFTQYRIGIYNSVRGMARKENYYLEHHDIIRALLEEDDKGIEEACVRHISRSQIISLKALKYGN